MTTEMIDTEMIDTEMIDTDSSDVDAMHQHLDEGERHGSAGRLDEAMTAFTTARDIARSLGDAVTAAHADDRLAAALWEAGRLREAERHLRAALAVHEAGSDAERLSWARYRLGWLLAASTVSDHRRQEALDLLGAARTVAADHDDRHRVASCDEKAAWVMADRGDHAEAVSLLHKVVAVFEALGAEADARTARANLGVQLVAVGALEEAEFQLRRAWNDGRRVGHPDPGVASRLARLLADAGDPEGALAVLDESATVVERAGAAERAAHHLARARACNVAQLRVASREAADAALVSLRGARLPGLHAEALEFRARCHEADAEARDGEEATRLTDRARAMLGESVALYLVADQLADARRVARDLVPAPPDEEDDQIEHVPLPTGVYL
jgi:tetratricopeptide (TPR) repeat protein